MEFSSLGASGTVVQSLTALRGIERNRILIKLGDQGGFASNDPGRVPPRRDGLLVVAGVARRRAVVRDVRYTRSAARASSVNGLRMAQPSLWDRAFAAGLVFFLD
jgi:hypothetical protein